MSDTCTWTRTDNPCPNHGWRCTHRSGSPCPRCRLAVFYLNGIVPPDDSWVVDVVEAAEADTEKRVRREAFDAAAHLLVAEYGYYKAANVIMNLFHNTLAAAKEATDAEDS